MKKQSYFEYRPVDFKTISGPLTPNEVICAAMVYICDVVVLWWDCDVIVDYENGWVKCIKPIRKEIYAKNVLHVFTFYFVILLCISYSKNN